MQLIIKNKWVSIGGSSTVQDVDGNDVLKVRGKVFSFTSKKYVEDLEGNVSYIVRNKFWRFIGYSAIIMDKDEKIVSTVKRKVFSVHDTYNLASPYGEIVFQGNILGYDYHINLNGEEVGHVSRKISLRDSFVLDLKDGLDEKFFVALLIAMDNITDRMNNNASASFSPSDN